MAMDVTHWYFEMFCSNIECKSSVSMPVTLKVISTSLGRYTVYWYIPCPTCHSQVDRADDNVLEHIYVCQPTKEVALGIQHTTQAHLTSCKRNLARLLLCMARFFSDTTKAVLPWLRDLLHCKVSFGMSLHQ